MSFGLVSSILYREVCCKMQAPRLIVDGERGNFAFLGIISRQEARDGDGTPETVHCNTRGRDRICEPVLESWTHLR